MLVYGDFLRAQALKYNKSVTGLVAEESALYPYKRKDIQKAYIHKQRNQTDIDSLF